MVVEGGDGAMTLGDIMKRVSAEYGVREERVREIIDDVGRQKVAECGWDPMMGELTEEEQGYYSNLIRACFAGDRASLDFIVEERDRFNRRCRATQKGN